jgi:iron complex transport system ATP-binding protein
VIALDHVTVRVRGKALLDDVSLAIASGEVVAVVGPNGAGKSTLLRVAAGDLAPASGTVAMGGVALARWSLRDRARVRAVVPQESELSFPFAAGEVVLLGRAPHEGPGGAPRDQAIARLAMRATGTLAIEDRPYATLSGGERQRIQAARAFAQIWEDTGPRALLLDEPTASLDLAHQHAILAEARRMAGRGVAVVCILHDLNLAARYADRIVVLARGRVAAMGRPRDVVSTALLGDVFGVDAVVIPHPDAACAVVVTRGPMRTRDHDSTWETHR